MLRKMLAVALTLALLALVVPMGWAEDKEEVADNPYYTAWASFKPGAVATHKEKVKYAATNPDGKNFPGGIEEKDITYTLKQVTKDKVVVQVVVVEHEALSTVESAPTKITYPAKVSKAELEEIKEKLKIMTSEDTLTFKGKTYKGKKVETTKTGEGVTTSSTRLISDLVPGGVVSRKTVAKKGDEVLYEATIELVDLKLPPPPKEKDKKKEDKKEEK